MDALAREVPGMSRAQFFRLFESSIRCAAAVSFSTWCAWSSRLRPCVEEAEPLAAISERLGFSAPAHFTRFFRDHAGVLPERIPQRLH